MQHQILYTQNIMIIRVGSLDERNYRNFFTDLLKTYGISGTALCTTNYGIAYIDNFVDDDYDNLNGITYIDIYQCSIQSGNISGFRYKIIDQQLSQLLHPLL